MQVNTKVKGNWSKAIKVMAKYKEIKAGLKMDECGEEMLQAIINKTPVDTGELVSSWDMKVKVTDHGKEVSITNQSHQEYPELLYGLEYGHGTNNGGYVKGTHFVENAMKKVSPTLENLLGGAIKDAIK